MLITLDPIFAKSSSQEMINNIEKMATPRVITFLKIFFTVKKLIIC